ncbi:MAG: DegV family EDD domain-containing protein [Oscillospiraceae bacterium]|jgi:DegV family protein with EDD domain|nr:DegV family EDD domain-containing protein [Oscillospiraceae bacterium]
METSDTSKTLGEYKLLGDSSCDLTAQQKLELNYSESIPFVVQLGGEAIIDEPPIDIPSFLAKMKACTGKMGSACASPERWKEAFIRAGGGFAVTLSSKLSGMHQSALIGLEMAKEEIAGLIGHVFDSKSAVCGEVLLAMKIREFSNETNHLATLVERVNRFTDNMKTLFVLDDISNLVKNGRMSKIKGTIVTALGIKPLLAANDGEIELHGTVRNKNKITAKLVEAIGRCGRTINGDTLVIAHCRNLPLAEELAEYANRTYKFGKTFIQDTGVLSSFYASHKGIIVSF